MWLNKSVLIILCNVFALAELSAQVYVSQISVPSNAMNCTSTTITVSGTNNASGYSLQTIVPVYSNDTIWVDIVYIAPQITLPVITPWSHNVVLGNVPYGSYTVISRGYLGSTLYSTVSNTLNIGACCPTAIPQWQFVEDTVCASEQISVINNSTGSGGLTYLWDYPGGSSTLPTPTFSISEPGTYNVTMYVTSDSCSDSLVRVIEVIGLPDLNLGSDTTICEDDTLVISLGGSNTFLWSDGSTSATNSLHGIGTLSVTVTDQDGCMKSDTISVTAVLDVYSVDIGNNFSKCPEAIANLDAGAGGSSYLWSNGDTTQMTQVLGSGFVFVTVTAEGYCDGTDEVFISLYSVDPVSINLDSDSCGQRLIYVNSGTHSINAWYDGSDSIARVVDVTDVYSVEALDNNGCASEDSTLVYVAELPQFYLGNDTFICANQTITLFTGVSGDHLWNTGGISSVLNVTNSGKYSVTVTTDEGCTFADTIKVNDCLGMNGIVDAGLAVYPTVSSDLITLSGLIGNEAIQVYDALGKQMKVLRIDRDQLSIESYNPGVYFIRVVGRETEAVRFIKR